MTVERISPARLTEAVTAILLANGVSEEQSIAVAGNMVWSELVGRHNFGIIRIPIHLKRLGLGLLNAKAKPVFEIASASSTRMDADNAFGHFAGQVGMEKAIDLARETGIGIVTIRRSNWYGTGAHFVKQAADAGMISIALSNSFPKVAAFGGAAPVFGTNPFAFGAPRKGGDHILVDFATSSLAGSTVREHKRENKPLPEGLATYPDGSPLTNPDDLDAGALLPFGGAKGYGVALMVEILAGVLAGSGFSSSVKSTYSNFEETSDSGHCLIAIDVETLMPAKDYHSRIEMLVNILKASSPSPGAVRLPGEIRWDNLRKNTEAGIPIKQETLEEFRGIAETAGVEF